MKKLTEEEIYRFCLLTGRSYFGSHLHATQGLPLRHGSMHCLVLNEAARRPDQILNILEIGSWAGGSAITWANALKTARAPGRVFCVDPWRPYVHGETVQSRDMKAMNQELQAGEIFPLFLHNIRTSGHEDIVVPIRGESSLVLPLLRGQQFPIVFVDGDHRFEPAYSDITQSLELVAPDGVLCGDDLELQISEIDAAEAWAKKDEDYIRDPKAGRYFHPGVTLAVGKVFDTVAVWDGFWAVRKTSTGWRPAEMVRPATVSQPTHLHPSSVQLTIELAEHLKRLGIF